MSSSLRWFSHRHWLVIVCAVVPILCAAALLRAEDQAPQVENAKQSFSGEINGNAVFIRSGPNENYYPTMKLDKGAQVVVVGMKFDWLKIVPPEGSFSYVPKAYVEKHGDGTKGRINNVKPEVPVRAGSSLNDIKTTVQTKLEPGDEVEILGEKDEYWRIKPPANSYVYVKQQYVDPVKPVESPVASATGQNNAPPAEKATEGQANNSAAIADTSSKGTDTATTEASASTTQPTEGENASTGGATSMASSSTTKPSDESAEARFDKLETEFAEVSKKPIEEQPVPELLSGYQALSKSEQLPSSLLRVVDLRIAALKARSETREQMLALKKIQEESEKRQMALKAEKQELDERIKNGPSIFTAVGTLQMSSLQIGQGGSLYRLTDPGTGRTVVYVRTNDEKFPSLLGKFIGVRGDVTTDERLGLRCVTPKSPAEVVDPNLVNNKVAAQIIPPSLIPQASTGTP